MMHPSSLDLEAFAVGERGEDIDQHIAECAACRGFVEKLGALPPVPMPKARPAKRSLAPIFSIVVPLAAAALFFFLLRRPQQTPEEVLVPVAVPTQSQAEPDTTFKGGLQIAVIRERGGDQSRFTRVAPIRPGDRLRVEVALDREEAILAGVLGDDGSWLELMSENTKTAGTHFSERSARVDAEPLRGTVLVGTPAAVQLARVTKSFDSVGAIRLDWEAP